MPGVHFVRRGLGMNGFIYVLSIAERELNLIVYRVALQQLVLVHIPTKITCEVPI